MNIEAVTIWLKIGGILFVVVGFGMLSQWYEETSNTGAFVALMGAAVAIVGFSAKRFAAVLPK
jgi:hypothetical protein